MVLQAPIGRCYVRSRRMWSSCPPLNHPTSVPTGPPIRPSMPSGSCYVSCSSSTKTRRSTCLSVTTLHAIINHWWNSAPFEGAVPSPSFSTTKKWTLWRNVCLPYPIPCVSAGIVSSSSARVATSSTHPQEARLGQTVCGYGIHKPDTSRHLLSGASFPHPTARVARLY